jgi:uncharacterized protein (TIGR00255 family)
MTGYGRGRVVEGSVEVVTEVKSVNHRFLDITFKMPRFYGCFEPDLKRIVSDTRHRGKIDVMMSRSGDKASLLDVVVDYDLAKCYMQCLQGLKETFHLQGPIMLSDILNLKDIVTPVEKTDDIGREWSVVENSLKAALGELDGMRRREGATLWSDVSKRLEAIGERAKMISPLVDQVTRSVRDRLEKRIRELTNGINLEQERLMQEAAIFAERSDVTEELTRLQSHLEQFIAAGRDGSPLGRKLDFLTQELQREINTLGSKSASTDIAHHVVYMKSELEKIREQIQNIE